MIVAVRARQYGKDALQELALLGLVAEVAVGDAKIEQRDEAGVKFFREE